MKVTQEKLPASQIGLEIEITPEMSKQAYEKTLQEFHRSINIPGFRKGKVPRQVLIQRIGATRIKATAIEDLIESSLKKAIEQEKIETISNFELRSSFDQLVSQFEPGVPLIFSVAADVSPQAVLTQYKDLQVNAEEVTYDPANVDEVLENYRRRSATLIPVEERSAQSDDVAVIDFIGHLARENAAEDEPPELISGGSANDFEIELAEGKFIPGFIDGIIGMNPGETKEVAVTFPEDYVQKDLAGKPAVFTITLKDLKTKELPELDDDFAQDVSQFETLAELRESLETRYQGEAEQQTKVNKEQALLDELVKYLEVELPETLIRQEIDYIVNQTAMQLSNQGIDIKQMFTPELVQRLREQSRPEAIARLRRTLALGEIAKQESIQVPASEVTEKVNEVLQDYAGQDVNQSQLRQVVEENLVKEKIFAWLEQHCTVELVPQGSLTPAVDASIEPTVEAAVEVADDDADDAAAAIASSTTIQTEEPELPEAADTTGATPVSTETATEESPTEESAEMTKKSSKSATKSAKSKSNVASESDSESSDDG